MFRSILPAAAAVLALGVSAAGADELTIVNKSKAELHKLYVSPSKSKKWGPDQLGAQSIDPGGSFTLQNIPYGTYDLKLVDEDDTECVIEDVTFDSGKVWTVTSKLLKACADFEDED